MVILKLAVVHFLVGEFEPCRRALARSLGGQSASSGEVLVSPTTVEAWQIMTFIEAGEGERAVAYVEKRWPMESGDGAWRWRLVAQALPPEQADLALGITDRLLAQAGGGASPASRSVRIEILCDAGRFEQAHKELIELMSDPLATDVPLYRELRVDTFVREGRLDDAIAFSIAIP